MFNSIYYLGMFIAVAGIFSTAQDTIIGIAYLPDFSSYILLISISHMLLLIALGFKAASENQPLFGEKIQTAGYLHTLIGFSIALLHISNIDFSLIDVMQPLGSALITSILGWFFGSEIASMGKSAATKSINNEMDAVATELSGFLAAIKKAHESYVTTIYKVADDYQSLHQQQKTIINHSTHFAEQLESQFNSTSKTLDQLSETIDAATQRLGKSFNHDFKNASDQILENAIAHANALKQASTEAKNTGQYLKETKVLINELEKYIEYLNENNKEHLG